MNNRYCYWSVATGPYAELMERCVASARRCGVFKAFHVLTDRPIAGCECYDAQTVEKTDGMFKLIYLKAGISKLLFDYFVWIDADSWFVRNPWNLLDCLGRSPVHVPLTANLSSHVAGHATCHSITDSVAGGTAHAAAQQAGLSTREGDGHLTHIGSQDLSERVLQGGLPNVVQYVELMTSAGVHNPVYLSSSAFWIVRREAIDRIVDLATHYRAFAKARGFGAEVSACLGYAMQMLCVNPEIHRVSAWPKLWASDDLNHYQDGAPDGRPWMVENARTGELCEVNPAIIHLPCRRVGDGGSDGSLVGAECRTQDRQTESTVYVQAR